MSRGSASGFSARRTWRLPPTTSRATSPPAPPPSRAGSWSQRIRSSADLRNSGTTPYSATSLATTSRTSSGISLARATASWATSATQVCPAVCATREVLQFTTKAPLRRGFLANRYFVVIVVSALLCAPIHRSAWNRNSANFALWAFKITHLRDAPEPLLLSTFLLTDTAIGRRGGQSMEQREVVLYTRSRSLRCWRAKRRLARGGESTPKEGWI